METKIPEWFLSFYERLLAAQLRAVRQIKSPRSKKTKPEAGKGISNMDMALDILRRAHVRSISPRSLPRLKPNMAWSWIGSP